MTLVTSPKLSRDDIEAIGEFYVRRSAQYASRTLAALFGDFVAKRLSSPALFGELLRRGHLRVFIARPRTAPVPAIYHEKFAIFANGTHVLAVSGSGNESLLALRGSFERFEVFRSWTETERRAVLRFQSQFADLVKNQTDGLDVVSLLSAYQAGWLEVRTGPPDDEQAPTSMAVYPNSPEVLVPFPHELFEHQKLALQKWAAAGGKGIIAMATGSGKTIAALSIAAKLLDALEGKPLTILIIAPFIHLVDQWIEVGGAFGLRPVRCAEGEDQWRDDLSTAIFAVNAGRRPVLSIASTSATLQTSTFQRLMDRVRTPLLVIGDEAHNYGSAKIAKSLPMRAAYRIGLSATPEKWMDPEGTARIRAYFGKPVYEYSLADALRDDVLTPYAYTPFLIEFDEDEAQQYEDISAKLARFGISEDSEGLSEGAKALLMRRARLLASAKAKLPLLRALLEPRRRETHLLIYCGDGRVEGDPDDLPPKQIDEVVRIASDLGIVCAKYTADTPPDVRRQVLVAFDEGRIQALVAIRCLDEGVDVPSTRTAFILSSSTNPRQFIQRRGRVLRRSPATGKRKAEIFDFFVIPPLGLAEGAASKAMRNVVRSQLNRVMEFSSLALNGPAARKALLDWTREHHLVELWGT
jgi:superfamily II DNA or RNA helicase